MRNFSLTTTTVSVSLLLSLSLNSSTLFKVVDVYSSEDLLRCVMTSSTVPSVSRLKNHFFPLHPCFYIFSSWKSTPGQQQNKKTTTISPLLSFFSCVLVYMKDGRWRYAMCQQHTHRDDAHVETCWVASNSLSLSLLLASRFQAKLVHLFFPLISSKSRNLCFFFFFFSFPPPLRLARSISILFFLSLLSFFIRKVYLFFTYAERPSRSLSIVYSYV
jgi:hypothetical protein